MKKKEILTSGEVDSSRVGTTPDTDKTGSVIDLEHTLNRFNIWLLLGRTNPEVANQLLDREKVEAAAEALSLKNGKAEQRAEILKALGLHEMAEREVIENKMSTASVLGLEEPSASLKKRKFDEIWTVEIGGERRGVEEWIEELKTRRASNSEDVAKLRSAIEQVKEKFGVESLKYVSLDAEKLAEIEDGVATLKAKKEYYLAVEHKENSGGVTPIAANFTKEIEKEDGLLQVRDLSKGPTTLGEVVKRVRDGAKETLNFEELDKLEESELLARFRDANLLLENIGALRGENLGYLETKRLKHILINLQTQYQEQLANKFAQQWQKDKKSGTWQEVRYEAVEKAINARRRWFSARVEFNENNEAEALEKLRKEATDQARNAASRMDKAQYKTGWKEQAPNEAEMTESQTKSALKMTEMDAELDSVIGNARYNLFDDRDFWADLQQGDEGIKRIVQRGTDQGVVDGVRFENLLHGMREKLQKRSGRNRYGMPGHENFDETPQILDDLMKYMELGEWGAAANAMMEYTTRVGMQENTNDLQFMYVRRNFLEKISKVSPDFAEQFGRNQQMGYLPPVYSQKPEDFYSVQGKIFAKGNTDLFFGQNAFMSGNIVELPDGKKKVISTKSFVAALRSERNILKIMKADPNTTDSTLQNIMLEELYGEGTRLGVVNGADGKDAMTITFADGTVKLMSEIKVKMQFAEIDKRGFKGWRKPLEEEINLEEMLNKNQWILRNGLNFMWYSEMWMDTLKSYQPSIMGNTPKALLTAASAIADYKASFELVAPPFLDLVQKIGDMLGPMERYKAADMVAKNVADRLTDELIGGDGSEDDRQRKRKHYESVGKLFEKIFVRKTKASLNGSEVELNNRIRSREMTRHAFNNYSEDSDIVSEIVRKRLIDLGMFPGDVPSTTELKKAYKEWKEVEATGKLMGGKNGYMGQEYAAVWEELKELKMTGERELWGSIGADEFAILAKINAEVTGDLGEKLTKDNFFSNFDIEAFMDRTGTKHGDDWEQFAIKYAPAKMEALKLVIKIASLNGTAADYDKLKQQLDLFMQPEDKRTLLLSLMDRQSIATREQWLVPYEVADIASDHAKGSFEVKWVDYTDSTGKKFFARTADGTRAYHKKQFRGNYARQVLDKDWWRPRDFELILEKWRGDGLLTKHEAHHMAEKLLGTKRSVDYVIDGAAKGLGIDPKNLKTLKDVITKSSTTVKLWALKLFLFDDPKYAMWTLFEEFLGFGGKTFEHIFGVAVGGGGGKHH